MLKLKSLVAVVVCSVLSCSSAQGQKTIHIAPPIPIPSTTAPSSTNHALTTDDLNAFFDGIFPLQLERSDIAGASVLVMQNGQVLLEKGYGYSDVKKKTPVDPTTTIFRLASISKLFTWVSVMQLVEQHKLNLDTDINQYLDFKIRPAFSKPITLRNLMTHTGGFEETINDIIVTTPKDPDTLRQFLIDNQPMRIYPPGKITAYSNYGVGLASYIVQRVSGEPFPQYVQNHIFTPLGMTHSSFDQPLPARLKDTDSQGYRRNTTKPPVGFEIFNPVGAGGISSTAADMGRFGQALLNGGELDGHRILRTDTLAQMWTPQYRANQDLPPICMGFYQDWRNNLRWIGHEGDLIAFHSLFFMEPSQKIVLFVSYNSAGGASKPRPEIINFFSDRYFPGAQNFPFLKTPANQLKDIEGHYESTRRADSTRLKLDSLFSQRAARINKDGELTLSGVRDLRGHILKWRPIGTDLWQTVDDQARIFAIRDAGNKIDRLAVDFPGVQFQRVPWYEDSRFVFPVAGTSLAIALLVVLTFLIRIGRRIFLRKRPRWQPQPGTLYLTFSLKTASLFWLLILGGILAFIASAGDNLMPPTAAWAKWFVLLNIVTAIALFFSLLAVFAAIRTALRSDLRSITKLKFSLVALACIVLSWFAVHWHIIGPVHRI
ncbi:MAG: serine hydrolase [Acidobacteriota bacterium]|nr:serine hydrolase [Acidobacteriota bacterium]